MALDHSVFYRRHSGEHTIIAVATDDMALTLRHVADIVKLKSKIHQHIYIEVMLSKFQLTNAKPVTMPMETGVQLMKEQDLSMLKQIVVMHSMVYTEAIGCVQLPVMITYLDCAFAVGILYQFIQNPGSVHWEA